MNSSVRSFFSLSAICLALMGCASAPKIAANASRANASQPSASEALSELAKGNQRFVSGNARADGQTQADIARLSTGQSPQAVVLSCSDSRVPPEAVFDQKLGEIFTVRTAGETLSPQAIGSIEFAIEKLGSRLIVVLGHTNCGAVKAAVETIDGKDAGSDNLNGLVRDIHPRIAGKFVKAHPSQDFREESWLNARGVKVDLLNRSSLIAKAVKDKGVEIRVGVYDLSTGRVQLE